MAKPKSLPYDAPEAEGPYSVGLYSQAGGSDKLYNLSIEPAGDGLWVVNYANGRRGKPLQSGTKTSSPVAYADARAILNDTLYSKVGSGYVPISGSRFGDGMTAEAIATIARESSGHLPQLLNPVGEEDLEALLEDDRYAAEVKHDGERRFVIVVGGRATGGNRTGVSVALPPAVAAALASIGDAVLDGEQVGDTYWCWDIVSSGGRDLRSLPWHERQAELDRVLAGVGHPVRRVVSVHGEAAKRELLEAVRATNGEGIVLKRRDAAYVTGRPGKGGDWLKFKLWKDLSAIVAAVNDRRSVALELVGDDGSRVPVGNVTIPSNRDMPTVGDVVDVTYLYAYEGGSLFQPNYRRQRTDIAPAECLASQRVFVAEPEEPVSGPRM